MPSDDILTAVIKLIPPWALTLLMMINENAPRLLLWLSIAYTATQFYVLVRDKILRDKKPDSEKE